MQVRIIIPVVNLKFDRPAVYSLDHFELIDCNDIPGGAVFSKNFKDQFGMISIAKILSSNLLLFQGDPMKVSFFQQYNTPEEIGDMALHFASSLFNALWFIKDNSAYVKDCFIESYEGEYCTDNFRSITCNRHSIARYNSNHSGNFITTIVNHQEISKLIEIDKKIKVNLQVDPAITGLIPRIVDSNFVQTDELNYIPYTLNRYIRALMILAKVQSEARVILKIAFQMSLYEALFTIGRERVTEQVSEKAALFIGGEKKEIEDNIGFFKKTYDIRSKFFHGDRIKENPSVLISINEKLDQCTRVVFNKVLDDLTIFVLSDSKKDKSRFRDYWKDLAIRYHHPANW